MKSNIRLISLAFTAFACLTTLSVSGCMDVKGPTAPLINDSDAFASLDFTTSVAYVKLGDTLPLNIVATAADGSIINVNTDSVRWTSGDSSLVYVDTIGRIIGRGINQIPVDVVARYRHAFTTRTDTIQVYVTPDKFTVSDVRITAIDSTRVGVGATTGLLMPRVKVDLIDEDGGIRNPSNLPIYKPESIILTYEQKGGPSGEPVYFVNSKGTYFGKFWIKASINFYGVEVRDSVEFTALHRYDLPAYQVIEQEDGTYFYEGPSSSGKLTIQQCGVIAVVLQIERPVDVVFSDSLASSDGCAPLSLAAVGFAIYLGDQYRGDFIGGNLLNAVPGLNYYFRRSNSKGEINWHLRDAVTKERLPIGGRFQVVDVE